MNLANKDRDRFPAYETAIDAAIWGTPIVSFDAMRQAFFRDAQAGYNDVVFWSKPADWKFRLTTPNASSHYVFSNFNTKDAAVVVEIPAAVEAGLFGSILDAWQVPLADIGPEGEDGGKGGKYLLLPPGYSEQVPSGYIPVHSQTFNGYCAFRAIPKGAFDRDVRNAIALVRKIAIYPLPKAAHPQPTRFVDMAGKLFDGIVRFDETFYESLARMLNEEPVLSRDKTIMDQLRLIGIEKGKEFKPDGSNRDLLRNAAGAVHAEFMHQAPSDGPVYWQGLHWRTPSAVGALTAFTFETSRGLDVNARGLVYFLGCAPSVRLGKASFYLSTFVDGSGQLLTGENNYRLHVPASVPAKQFWALTLYDSETAAFIQNMPRVELNSYSQRMRKNNDGSVDLYFGAEAPAFKESNWISTAPGRRFFMLFRLYGPEKPILAKTWQLPNVEKTSRAETHNLARATKKASIIPIRSAAQKSESDGHGWIDTETVKSRLGNFDFRGGYPTEEAAEDLSDVLILSRAVEVYLAQMPAVSWFRVWKAIRQAAPVAPNQVVVWESLMDARTLLLTGNSETVYGLTSLDLKRDGPIVIEVPSMLLGGINDMWQHTLATIGPTGVDKGKGGNFLLLPPDYQGQAPQNYFTIKCTNYQMSLGVRGFLVDGKTDKAVASLKTMKIYSLSQAAKPPAMTFVNGSGKEFDTIFRDNFEFFSDLSLLVEREPIEILSSQERFQLAAIGIEKGKPFTPSPERERLLTEAARMGSAVARGKTFASTDPERLVYPDRRWEWAFIGGSANWDSEGYVNTDRRAAFAYAAIGMSPAMVDKVVGEGGQYLWTMRDSAGEYLEGGKSYHLYLPPHIPVKNFWSVVVYDAVSRSMLRNGQPFPSVSLYTGPEINSDGSVDIYFGPEGPDGKERNWIKTVAGKGWFPMLRFYGPLQPFFDKTWKPDDIAETKGVGDMF